MNKTEIAKLLTVASGFDRRQVDTVTVEAWALVPGIRDADYEDALAALISHVTGPNAKEYLTVNHIVGATQVSSRQTKELIAADVRSARARGLIAKTWPETQPVTDEVRTTLAVLRDEARNYAALHPLDGDYAPIEVGTVGRVPA